VAKPGWFSTGLVLASWFDAFLVGGLFDRTEVSAGSGPTNYTLSAASGTFAATGTGANLRHTYRIASSSGAYAHTGTSATLFVTPANPWTHINTTALTYDASAAVVVAKPANVAAGHLLIAPFDYDQAQEPISGPSGWTEIGTRRRHGTTGLYKLSLWYKIAGASEPANYTWSQNAAGGGCAAAIGAYSGVDQTTPVDVVNSASNTTSNPTVTSITTTVANTLLFFACADETGGTYTPPSGMTERFDIFGCTAADKTQTASGATGDVSITHGTDQTAAFLAAFRPASGATGYILPAGSGSFTETGSVAALKYARRVGAAAGSFATTGVSSSLEYGRRIAVASGAYVQTGTIAALRQTRRVAATGVTYSAAGPPATLRVGHTLAAGSAAYNATGAPIALAYGREVVAASGIVVLTGQQASVRVVRKVTAASGTFAATGTAAGIRATWKILVGAGAYGLTGSAANISKISGYAILANSGSFSLTGSSATIRQFRKVAASGGVITVSGTAAGCRLSRKVAANTRVFVAAGSAASLRIGRRIAALSGTQTLAGQGVTLRAHRRITVNAGVQHTMNGSPATLVYLVWRPSAFPSEQYTCEMSPEKSSSTVLMSGATSTIISPMRVSTILVESGVKSVIVESELL
jgi:hypothetical protein